MFKFLKGYFKKSIKKIAKENEKSFGNSKLDCCDLNKSNNRNRVDNEKK